MHSTFLSYLNAAFNQSYIDLQSHITECFSIHCLPVGLELENASSCVGKNRKIRRKILGARRSKTSVIVHVRFPYLGIRCVFPALGIRCIFPALDSRCIILALDIRCIFPALSISCFSPNLTQVAFLHASRF